MCGIAGIISADPSAVTRTRLEAMTDAIAHRGPDGAGHWIDPGGKVGLGNRRLAVIDLTESGRQPMHYAEGRYTITFNGEIYNYLEIREGLRKKGYRFQSGTDTEVLLALYDLKGQACLDDLDGMFAFAIFDEKEQQLFCARDRFGEKPFFYCHEPGRHFLFGSEMKALWASGVARSVCPEMMYNYLAFGLLHNTADLGATFFVDIRQLENGHWLKLDTATLDIEKGVYWDINPDFREEPASDLRAARRFEELLLGSLNLRMRADVPVGSSLSGGLDSSLLVCLMSRLPGGQDLSTFSARFPGFAKDEGVYIRMTRDFAHARGMEAFPGVPELLRDWEAVCRHQEEPFGSAGIVAQYEVMKLAAGEGVTVLLDGQGADEVMGGYDRFHQGSRQRIGRYIPWIKRRMLKTRLDWMQRRHPLFRDAYYRTYRDRDHLGVMPGREYAGLNRMLYEETVGGPLQVLLRYADRNAMAHSREVRLPYLDHRLVAYWFTLPDRYKLRNGWTKYLMRASFPGLWPGAIAWRKDKIGYEAPQVHWMNHPEVRARIRAARERLASEGILHPTRLLAEPQGSEANVRGDGSWQIWMAGNLYILCE